MPIHYSIPMRSLMLMLAGCFMALCAATSGVAAEVAAPQPSPMACPAPADLTPQHLYGTWLAQVEGEAGPVTIRLGKHPEFAGSVAGELERAGRRAQVAGDVDEGYFTLEESNDGQHISATWIGQVVDASCGKEIKGTWTKEKDTSPNAARSFTLRKQGGWQ